MSNLEISDLQDAALSELNLIFKVQKRMKENEESKNPEDALLYFYAGLFLIAKLQKILRAIEAINQDSTLTQKSEFLDIKMSSKNFAEASPLFAELQKYLLASLL